MFSFKLAAAIAVLVLIITGVSYASTQANSENLDPSTYKDPNQFLKDIAADVPEFGGAFISDNGTVLNIYLASDETNRAKQDSVQEAMEDKFGVKSGLTLNVIKGVYTLDQLSGWYDTIHTQDFWDVEGAPAGMAVDPDRGAVSWTPGVDHAGSVAGAELVAGDGLRSVSRSFRFRVVGLAPLDPSWHDLLRAGAPGSSFYGVDPSYLPSWPPGVVRASGFLLVSSPGEGGAFLELPVSDVPRGAWFDRLRFYSYTPPGGWRAVYEGSWDMSRDPPVFSAGVPGPWAVGFFGYGPAPGPPSVESSLSCRLSADPVPPPSRIFSGARALPPRVGGPPSAHEIMSALGSAMDFPPQRKL